MHLNSWILIVVSVKTIQSLNYPGKCPRPPMDLELLDNLPEFYWYLQYSIPDSSDGNLPFFRKLNPSQISATYVQFNVSTIYNYQVNSFECLNIVGNLSLDAANTSYHLSYQVQVGIAKNSKPPSSGCFRDHVYNERGILIFRYKTSLVIWKCIENEEWNSREERKVIASHDLAIMVMSYPNAMVKTYDEFTMVNFTKVPISDWKRFRNNEEYPKPRCSNSIHCPLLATKWTDLWYIFVGLFLLALAVLLPLVKLIKGYRRAKVVVVPQAQT